MAQAASMNSTRQMVMERRRAMSSSGKAALGSAQAAAPTRGARPGAQPAAARSASAPAPARTPRVASGSTARSASLARREAMSSRGKAAVQSADRTRGDTQGARPSATPAAPQPSAAAEKRDCGCGCKGEKRSEPASIPAAKPAAPIMNGKNQSAKVSSGRAASLARRKAMSGRGKAALSNGGMTAAQTARAANPQLSSRELAQALREQRSRSGKSGEKKSRPSGRARRQSGGATTGAAQDAPWKVGASETSRGQTVTGTMVGRQDNMTGDEPSTCRAVTGTEYLGADIFRDFCQTDASASTAKKVVVTSTSHGNAVSGNRIGRGKSVTGNEQGTCKNVTGDEYISAEQQQAYCGEFAGKSPRKVSMAQTMKGKSVTGDNVGRSEKVTGDEPGMSRALTGTQYTAPQDIGGAPAKVGASATLRGGSVTGTMVGRRENMTGDEAGSCRDVTGDDYVGQEQYSGFCNTAPQPQDKKVGISATLKGKTVTGTMTGRGGRVTGDEPGTCKAVTGTPYAGAEQLEAYCPTDDAQMASARTRQRRGTAGPAMTGLQPGVGGTMTGDRKGACEDVSGTPYVGSDQFAAACPSTPAEANSPDFPQAVGSNAPWGQFSVSSPAGEAAQEQAAGGSVTGSRYEQGHITGPFGMASGKVTGTEQARFDRSGAAPMPATEEQVEGRVKARISGEGMDAGLKITGDDWDRGDNVTGTEGMSATRRNPTQRSAAPGMAMAAAHAPTKRNEEMTVPMSKVTGGSGNTDKGSLITYSGGARG